MDEIQRHIAKREKRYAIFRRYRAGDDKEAITTWRLDLNRILRLFKVCSVTPARRLFTLRFQIEYAHATVSDTHHDQYTIGTHVVKTRAVDPGSYNNKSKNHEGTGGKNQAANTIRTLPVTKQPVLTPTQTHARSVISAMIESTA